MTQINIAGVPEHFNLPWHRAMEKGLFAASGLEINWIDVPEGTGRMCQMLEDGEADLAVILTEGIVKSIHGGNPAKILQEYVASPLLWGIHVAYDSQFESLGDLKGRTAAISRFGSGSHLMTFVLAQMQVWPVDQLSFYKADNLEGGIEALSSRAADFFLWEHFTTKPLVEQRIFRHLGDCPTPWPCFVIAGSDSALANMKIAIGKTLEIINGITIDFKQEHGLAEDLAARYGQRLEAVEKWLGLTRWSQQQIKLQNIDNVIDTLYNLKLIDNKLPHGEILTSL